MASSIESENERSSTQDTFNTLIKQLIDTLEYNQDERSVAINLTTIVYNLQLNNLIEGDISPCDQIRITVENNLSIHFYVTITLSEIRINTQSVRHRLIDVGAKTTIKVKLYRYGVWRSIFYVCSSWRQNYRHW